jgi:hypothetical protein
LERAPDPDHMDVRLTHLPSEHVRSRYAVSGDLN